MAVDYDYDYHVWSAGWRQEYHQAECSWITATVRKYWVL